MRCGRSVVDPPDDPVVVEAPGEVAERLVELPDGTESVQPQQLLPFRVRMKRSTQPLPSGWRTKDGLGLDAEGLELSQCAQTDRAVYLVKFRELGLPMKVAADCRPTSQTHLLGLQRVVDYPFNRFTDRSRIIRVN